MRAFARPTPIGRLSPDARWVYTLFLCFMLAGYASAAWLYLDDELDLGPEAAETYYLGAAPEPVAPAAPAPAGGPAFELPPAEEIPPAAEPLRLAKPRRQVVETTHFHLFSVSVCYLILAHLFMMCSLPDRLRRGVVIGSGLASLLHVITPALIVFASPGLAWLMGPSAVVMGLGWIFMTLWPLYELWRPQGPAREAAGT